MSHLRDYLISTGRLGDLGRFQSAWELSRGSRALVRTARGEEVGTVLRHVTPRLAELIKDQPGGAVLRPLQPEDEVRVREHEQTATTLVARAEQLGVVLLDAEVFFDGSRAVLYYAGLDPELVREVVRQLSREHQLTISADNLGPAPTSGGCGSGGCGSCGTVSGDDVREYFAGLREEMESHRRVPLL